jgi:hypothetical protein
MDECTLREGGRKLLLGGAVFGVASTAPQHAPQRFNLPTKKLSCLGIRNQRLCPGFGSIMPFKLLNLPTIDLGLTKVTNPSASVIIFAWLFVAVRQFESCPDPGLGCYDCITDPLL